jgi:hypothetical protein
MPDMLVVEQTSQRDCVDASFGAAIHARGLSANVVQELMNAHLIDVTDLTHGSQ